MESQEWLKELEAPVREQNDVNRTGYVAGGNLDFNRRPRPRTRKKPTKSTWIAYLLWLIGGWCGLHLLYLRRDKQAFIWYTTIGGYLGVGLARDFVRLPSYVRDVNEDEQYVKELTEKMRKCKKPPFNLVRFVGQILVGNSWSFILAAAVPREEIFGFSLMPLVHLAPIGTALAVWIIGNIGREQGQFKWALMGAYAVIPLSFIHPPLSNSNAITSTLLFNMKGKEWRRTPYPKHHICKRLMVMGACWAVFCGLWASHLYFNVTVTDKHGEEIKLRDAACNFLNSPLFLEFKRNLYVIYNDTIVHGWSIAWMNFVELLDPHGEIHAYKVLGVEKGANQEDITAAYRKLVREWHPDRHKDEKKDEAHVKFMEVQEAYDRLSLIRNKRLKRNQNGGEKES
ncbi:hypothetical protein Pmani_013673 [Petrolisthes manimaculis]|uniref:DnaJ homolog subfamily C member 22 n=1 Tax=Petrolisthes manimaculis TaxID=1843537 RepID=A0AAE1UDV7_9EUCA|nr:hypothetical protein Pmani_013673 [Petrolisthes manimaculis]